jgi:hypothetical protein
MSWWRLKPNLTKILATKIPTSSMADSFFNENGLQRAISVLRPTE